MESSDVEAIFKVIDQLKATVEKAQTKIVDINKKLHKFTQNSLLDVDSLYLSFQVALLTNEKTYFSGIIRMLEEKLFTDMVNIYEKILMLITSLEMLDIEHEEEKNNIIVGVRKFQRADAVTCTEILNLASCSISNLELVKRFTDLFDSYIKRLEAEHRKENVHCANLTVSLNNRKRHIEVEYEKYSQQLVDLITYFGECTGTIAQQLEHQNLLQFLTYRSECI